MLIDIPGVEDLTDAEHDRLVALAAWFVRVSRAKNAASALREKLDSALVVLVGEEPITYSEAPGVLSCYSRVTKQRADLPADIVALYEQCQHAHAACFERMPS